MRIAAVLLSAVLAAACAAGDAAQEPVWGKEPCAHCAMTLADERYGAELLSKDGDRAYFDDVGCLVIYLEEHQGSGEPRHLWARDAETGKWLDARSARYSPSATPTPMDFGFEAHAAGTGAGWDEMRAAVLARLRRES
jgi:copper chaperone NosL